MEGQFYSLDEFNKKINIKDISIKRRCDVKPEGSIINHFPAIFQIKSIQKLVEFEDKKLFRITYNSGDFFEGRYNFQTPRVLTGEGVFKYHDKRYPDIEVKIKNNIPVSGEGILDLKTISTTFTGNFNEGGAFTALNTKENIKDEYKWIEENTWKRKRTYLDDGRTLETIQSPLYIIKSGQGLFKFHNLEVDAIYKDTTFSDCKILNTQTGIRYFTQRIKSISQDPTFLDTITQFNDQSSSKEQGISAEMVFSQEVFTELTGDSFIDYNNKNKLKMKSKSSKYRIMGEFTRQDKTSKSIGNIRIIRDNKYTLLQGIEVFDDGTVQLYNIKKIILEPKSTVYKRHVTYHMKLDYPHSISITKERKSFVFYLKGDHYLVINPTRRRKYLGLSKVWNNSNFKYSEGELNQISSKEMCIQYESRKRLLIFGNNDIQKNMDEIVIDGINDGEEQEQEHLEHDGESGKDMILVLRNRGKGKSDVFKKYL